MTVNSRPREIRVFVWRGPTISSANLGKVVANLGKVVAIPKQKGGSIVVGTGGQGCATAPNFKKVNMFHLLGPF